MREGDRSPGAEDAAADRDARLRSWFQPVSPPWATVISAEAGQDESGTRDASLADSVADDATTAVLSALPDRDRTVPRGVPTVPSAVPTAPSAGTDEHTEVVPAAAAEAGLPAGIAEKPEPSAAIDETAVDIPAVVDVAPTTGRNPGGELAAAEAGSAPPADTQSPAASMSPSDDVPVAATVVVPVLGGPGFTPPDSVAEVTDDAGHQPTTGSPEASTPSAAPGKHGSQPTNEPIPGARGWFLPRRAVRPVEGNTVKDEPKVKRSRQGFFGLPPTSRPDVLTDAETVMLPQFQGDVVKTVKGSAKAAATDERPTSQAKAGAPSGLALAEAPTQVLPAFAYSAGFAPVRHLPKPAAPRTERYVANPRAKSLSRLVLIALLCVQVILSLRLRNTAFEDEAQYLYAGHMELQHLLHGTALPIDFASYFSGSPVLYPVLAAALDQVGGLALARALSLVEMLAVTTMVYSIARYLFNERIGLYSAALFAVAESTIFLGNFATFDATCLFLLAFAAWIMVYTARCRWPLFLLAAPVAATAVATKYAGLIFVPTIALLPVLTAWPYRLRRVWFYPVVFAVAVAGLLYAGLRLGGHDYIVALQSTTTDRALGATPPLVILREFAEWGGVVFAVAAFGSVAYTRRVRTEPNEDIAPSGSRLRRAVLGAVLTGTALLAPAYQAHLHTDTSFWKHVGFGLFFAAPMAGFGFARLVGDFVRRPYAGVAVWSVALVLGIMQSGNLYHAWPDSKPFVTAFSAYLEPNARYLVEIPEVPTYYLMGNPDARPEQFYSTFSMTFDNAKGQTEHGDLAFALAAIAGYFHVIAYCNVATPAVAATLQSVLQQTSYYRLAKVVQLSTDIGPVEYYIWVRAPGTMTYLTPASNAVQPNRFTKFG